MSHMLMDHLEGLELSEMILHRVLAPARLSPLALRYASTGLHVTFPSPWQCTATPHMDGHWADMLHICYGHMM